MIWWFLFSYQTSFYIKPNVQKIGFWIVISIIKIQFLFLDMFENILVYFQCLESFYKNLYHSCILLFLDLLHQKLLIILNNYGKTLSFVLRFSVLGRWFKCPQETKQGLPVGVLWDPKNVGNSYMVSESLDIKFRHHLNLF